MVKHVIKGRIESQGPAIVKSESLEQGEIGGVGVEVPQSVTTCVAERGSEDGVRFGSIGNYTDLGLADLRDRSDRNGVVRSIQVVQADQFIRG